MSGVRSSVRKGFVSFVGVMLWTAAVYGQSITDAGRAEFAPSPDHSALSTSGTPLVQGYSLQIFVAGQAAVVQEVNLGKPNPDTDGLIRVNFLPLLTTPLAAGVTYESRVGASGPGGIAWSGLSNTFSFTPTCGTPTVSPLT